METIGVKAPNGASAVLLDGTGIVFLDLMSRDCKWVDIADASTAVIAVMELGFFSQAANASGFTSLELIRPRTVVGRGRRAAD